VLAAIRDPVAAAVPNWAAAWWNTVYESVQQHAPDILVFANGREAGRSDAVMVAAATSAMGPGTI
jgi:FPC/CPF motif-containing protein YcgG